MTRAAGSCGAGASSPACARAYAYDEIAREEQLTPERVRQIVREALARRIVDDETDHAKLQWLRLAQAMQIGSMAVADGDVKAIPAFLKVLDRLDRYQRTAKVSEVYDDEARKRLFDKINRVAANLGLDETRTAIEGPAEGSDSASATGIRGGERKNGVGGRHKPLKRLDSTKEIQGFLWLKFGRALPDLAPIWLDLDFPWIFLGAPRRLAV